MDHVARLLVIFLVTLVVFAAGAFYRPEVLDSGVAIDSKVRDVVALVRPDVAGFDQAIFEALRTWRREVSERQGVPAYVVLHDRTMEEIAARKPASELELSVISGIGPSKLEHYGEEILAVVESKLGESD